MIGKENSESRTPWALEEEVHKTGGWNVPESIPSKRALCTEKEKNRVSGCKTGAMMMKTANKLM